MKIFPAHDPEGEVFVRDGRLYRGIVPGSAGRIADLVDRCAKSGLFSLGIVPTRISQEVDTRFGLVLEHERLPVVTYPHEWPAERLRAAALFHLDLSLSLLKHGLMLKDAHPYNILFRGHDPVFIDFPSLIAERDLLKVEYLEPGRLRSIPYSWWSPAAVRLYEMFRRMFVPFFLLPLALMRWGRYGRARGLLARHPLNGGAAHRGLSDPCWWMCLAQEFALLPISTRADHPRRFFGELRNRVKSISLPAPSTPYVDYYRRKNEADSLTPSASWNAKQRGVHAVLCEDRPENVLDIGCNVGWYTLLASGLGASVVALDTDEGCVHRLHDLASRNALPVTPIMLDILRLLPEKGAPEWDGPWRLSSDAVLALGILHHLVLGRGVPCERVVELLSSLARHTLIVEFVPKDDELVAANPDFFPAWRARPNGFDDFALERVTTLLRTRFDRVEASPSHPATRTLLICRRT